MYMTLVVVIDETSQGSTENHSIDTMDDIKTICNIDHDTPLSIYEWCIDEQYYSVFYLENDTSGTVHYFPPPLSDLNYKGNILIVMSHKSILNEVNLTDLLYDVTYDDWKYINSEICGKDDDTMSERSNVSQLQDTYESFYIDDYDSNEELSGEEYISD
jgi:hypothetical protein